MKNRQFWSDFVVFRHFGTRRHGFTYRILILSRFENIRFLASSSQTTFSKIMTPYVVHSQSGKTGKCGGDEPNFENLIPHVIVQD